MPRCRAVDEVIPVPFGEELGGMARALPRAAAFLGSPTAPRLQLVLRSALQDIVVQLRLAEEWSVIRCLDMRRGGDPKFWRYRDTGGWVGGADPANGVAYSLPESCEVRSVVFAQGGVPPHRLALAVHLERLERAGREAVDHQIVGEIVVPIRSESPPVERHRFGEVVRAHEIANGLMGLQEKELVDVADQDVPPGKFGEGVPPRL